MKRTSRIWLIPFLALAGAVDSIGDDITGANRILCTSVQATECFADGSCLAGQPEDWNIPRFMELDLAEKTLSTTRASGEERSTQMQSFERDGDRVWIQGAQTGRAFSVVVNESTGLASTGVALDGHVLSIFSYCTPLESTD